MSLCEVLESRLRKIIVFGNSGAGKSTLSKELCANENLAHLDLDTLAFQKNSPTERKGVDESMKEIKLFIEKNDSWVIEGGYADIFEELLHIANEMIFLDLPVEACQKNARNRAWEPHKYDSKEAQDNNLKMLLNWILGYYSRDDSFSKLSHDKLFNQFSGSKVKITCNQKYTK